MLLSLQVKSISSPTKEAVTLLPVRWLSLAQGSKWPHSNKLTDCEIAGFVQTKVSVRNIIIHCKEIEE